MKRSRSFNQTSGLPPVQTIELRDGKKWKTAVAVVLLLAVGFYFLGRGVNLALYHQGGWTEIEARVGSPGCAGEFQFRYELDSKNGNAEYRALSTLYTEACERAAKVYSSSLQEPGLGNLCALNASPNQELPIEPELFAALEKIRSGGSRTIYMAPLYEYYSCLFFCETDEETVAYDPLRNEELAQTFGELAAFARDPSRIDIELLDGNRACLRVSEDYLRYARENGIERLVDFGWMKNAFILDDLTAAIRGAGYTRGYLQSAEGFGCNLCGTKESFALNVFDRAFPGDGVIAQMTYDRPITFLSLHSTTNTPRSNDLFYEYADGQTRAIFLDPADGMPRTAIDDLLLWSDGRSCGELVQLAEKAFVGERFDSALLEQPDLFAAYCSGHTLVCSDPAVSFPALAEEYTLEQPKG